MLDFSRVQELRNFMDSVSREEIAVIVSGIVSMGLEILAGRVLAPRFGSTIYTWGSILGISMLALSLGYHYGGKSSSRIDRSDLERYLIYTSGYILFVLYLGEEVLSMSAGLPINPIYSPIVPVTLLFGPPTFFLGFISPYAAQLSSKNTKGEASGHFYAIGTAGSIAGAFGTTFLLVPYFNVDTIYLFFALLSTVPLIKGLKSYRTYYSIAVLVIGFLMIQSPASAGNVVHSESTVYQELEVSDRDGVRTLYLDGQPQSAVYLNGSGYPWEYPEYFHIPLLMRDDVDKALFIGGGGFVAPQEFAEMGVEVDAVELDPAVIRTAKKYFNLSESENLEIHTGDGREFLEKTDEEFDVIYMDAYRKSRVPFHLTTQEFMELTHSKTDEDGIVMSNLISTSSGPGSQFAKAQYRTMDSVFNSTYFFPTTETNLAQNIELIASKQPELTKEELLERAESYERKNLTDKVRNLQQIDAEDATLLTDDYAPVDRLLNPLIGQEYVVS